MSLASGNTVRSLPLGPAQDARSAILAALQTVDGLTAYPSVPDAPQAFDAFPRWALTNYTRGRLSLIAVHEYDAMVILPAGYEPDTVEQGDALLDRVASALYGIGLVRQADPIQLALPNGTGLPALRVRIVPHLNNRED